MTPKSIYQVTLLGALALFLYGCGSSGIQMRSYAEDRPRVDQEIAGVDNQGYVGGEMKSSDIAARKQTRKIYVLEIAKGAGNIKPIMEEGTSTGGAPKAGELVAQHFTEYTVDKDDTLQKIAKKFYDSYSKWPRIYEANKSILPNPDRLRPGTLLQIPLD